VVASPLSCSEQADNKHAVAEVDYCCPGAVIQKVICSSGVDSMPCHMVQKAELADFFCKKQLTCKIT